MMTDKEVSKHVATLRLQMSVFAEIFKKHSSKQDLFNMLRATQNKMAQVHMRYEPHMSPEDFSRVQIAGLLMAVIIEVLENNPMFDSHGLSLQLHNSIDNVLDKFVKQIKESKHEPRSR